MKSSYVYLSSALAAAILAGGLTADASDWPRWGGPDPGRDMISPETGLPDRFTTSTNGHFDLKPGSDQVDVRGAPNVKWVAKVGSQSYGNVVVAGGKVNDWENLGLLSSPTVEANRVYIVTSRCEVMCLSTEGMANGNQGPFT